MLIIDAIEKVVDRAFELVKARRLQGTAFYDGVVAPIQARFVEFREQHIATIKEVHATLGEPSGINAVADLPELLRMTTLVEAGHAAVFSRLRSLVNVTEPRLRKPFHEYVEALDRCLVDTEAEGDPYSFSFYGGLKVRIAEVAAAVEHTAQLGDATARRKACEQGRKGVEEIAQGFHKYCADVDIAHSALRYACTR